MVRYESGRQAKAYRTHEGDGSMRLKLIISASLLAAVLGAGACTAILLAFFSSLRLSSSPSLLVVSTFVLPTAAIVFASVFVYRHTSRRRKLQAIMTAILSIILTISFFVIAIDSNFENPGRSTAAFITDCCQFVLSGSNQFPPAPASTRRSQSGCVRRDRLPIPQHPA